MSLTSAISGRHSARPRPRALPRLTCDYLVTYYAERGRGVQSTRGPDPEGPARRAVSRRRADARLPRGGPPDDALRRDEAPAGARRGRARHHAEARPREAALPEPRPDQAGPRPVGQQVRR